MKQPVFLQIIKPTPANFTEKKFIGRIPGVSRNFRKTGELALDTGTQGYTAKPGSHQRFGQGRSWPWHHQPWILVTTCSRLNCTQPFWMITGLAAPPWRSKLSANGLWLAEPWSNVHRQVQGIQTGLVYSPPASRGGSQILTSTHLGFTKTERVFGC